MNLDYADMQIYDEPIEEALRNGVSAGTISGMVKSDQTRDPDLICLPDSTIFEYVQHKEQRYLAAVVASQEKEVDNQAVIDLAMLILERNGAGIYLKDLSVYGDRPDNLGIDDGGNQILFYATPQGIRINIVTVAHMERLQGLISELDNAKVNRLCDEYKETTRQTSSSSQSDVPSDSKLLQQFLHFEKEQIRYTKALLFQHSKKSVPDIHPNQERFEYIKTFDDFALHIAYPDTATTINEELNWWGLHFETDFEAVNHALCSSTFRYSQYEVLAELGYEKAVEVIALDEPEIPCEVYDYMQEHFFISELKEELIPPIAIQALQTVPAEKLQQISHDLNKAIFQLAVLEEGSAGEYEQETSKCKYEREIRSILTEKGLTAQDLLGTQTPEQAIAEHNQRQVWLQRHSQTRKLLNALPFLRSFHCAACGVLCAEEYCDRCQPMVKKNFGLKLPNHYYIYHQCRYVKPEMCVTIHKSPDEMRRLVYYLMQVYLRHASLLSSCPDKKWYDDEGILSEELHEILIKYYGATLTRQDAIKQYETIEILELHNYPSFSFPLKIDKIGSHCFRSFDQFAMLTQEFWMEGLGETIFAIACRKSIPNLEEVGEIKSLIRDLTDQTEEVF